MRGGKKATGRYETREELVREVWHWYDQPGIKQSQVARITRVSEYTVSNILKEGRPDGNTKTDVPAVPR